MADQSDVEIALVGAVAAALYPAGTDADSVCGVDCRVFRGWPNPAALDADLAAGRVNVTVFPVDHATRNTTRYPNAWQVTAQPAPALRATVTGDMVAFAGEASAGQLAGVLADGISTVHRTLAGDTPESVAAILAALIRAERTVQLDGATLAIPGVSRLVARTVADGTGVQETRRQMQRFRIVCWCPTPAKRDTAVAAIDAALAGVAFLPLADGTPARLRFEGTTVFDQSQDASLYRRDLLYDAEYPTTLVQAQPAMLFGDLVLNAASFTG
jgi:hypothetical protein